MGQIVQIRRWWYGYLVLQCWQGKDCAERNVPDMGLDSVGSSDFGVFLDGIGTYSLLSHPISEQFLMELGLTHC